MPLAARLLPAVVAVLAAAAPAAADPYRDPNHHFTFDLPPGWVPIPRAELEMVAAVADRIASAPAVRYEAGFRPADRRPGNLPYLLVQVFPETAGRRTFDDFDRQFSQGLNNTVRTAGKKMPGLFTNVRSEPVALDRDRGRGVARVRLESPGAPVTVGMSGFHFGRTESAVIHFYMTEDRVPTDGRVFDAVNDSFRFDPGHGYSPPLPWASNPAMVMALAGVAGGVGAGVLGGMFQVVRRVRRNRRRRPADVNDSDLVPLTFAWREPR